MGLNIKDIPDSLLNHIKHRFEAEPHVHDLRILQQYYLKNGQLEKSLELARELDALFADTLRLYIQRADSQKAEFDTETMDISRKDKDEMNEVLMVLFMCCDIIETSIMDLNDVLHRNKKDLRIIIFDDIEDAMKMAKEKMAYFSKNSDYAKDLAWGDGCDKMYEMMRNKSRSIIRKRKENGDNWGKNAEKLMKK